MNALKICAAVSAAMLLGMASVASALDLDGGTLTVDRVRPIGSTGTIGTNAVDPNAIYSNVTTFAGQGVRNGVSTTAGAVTNTNVLLDDLTIPTGGQVTTIRFSVVNFNTTAPTVRPRYRIYTKDANNNPVANVAAFSFNPFSFAAGQATTLSGGLGAGFALPAGDYLVGLFFDNAGGATATAADMANYGMGVYGPPDLGSSPDAHFITAAGYNGAVGTIPTGTYSTSPFLGAPVANYGLELVITPIPEPMALGALAPAALGLMARRRRA